MIRPSLGIIEILVKVFHSLCSKLNTCMLHVYPLKVDRVVLCNVD